MADWSTQDMPDLDGRVAVVTGANSGLGLETARGLAGAGATVVLGCRSLTKAQTAAIDIREDHPQATLEVIGLDLAELGSIEAFAQRFRESYKRLDVLVNNAGVMALPLRRTAEGFEMQVGTNHLGHFALTGRLMPALKAGEHARVVTLSSLAHSFGRIDLDDLNWHARRYRKWPAYGQAKLANLMFALEFQRRLESAGLDIISVAAHPGYAATHLQFAGPEMTGSTLAGVTMGLANRALAQSPADGALPSLYAASAAGVAGGEFFGPDGYREFWGTPTRVEPAGRANKREVAEALWGLSERLTGVTYP